MKQEDFDTLALLVKQRSGLFLTADKAYLLESRLLPVARKYNLKTLEDTAQALRTKREENMMHDIVEAMTVNETWFFRDAKVFQAFRAQALPRLLQSRADKKILRIWSAGASSGQEAYSLAMLCAEESAQLQDWTIEIAGTDLSREMIRRAKSGTYSQLEAQRGLPSRFLIKYFQCIAGDKWQIRDDMRQKVKFSEANLLTDFAAGGTFDVIFCRYVLDAFDPAARARVERGLSDVTKTGAVLVLGEGEKPQTTSDFKAEGAHSLFWRS